MTNFLKNLKKIFLNKKKKKKKKEEMFSRPREGSLSFNSIASALESKFNKEKPVNTPIKKKKCNHSLFQLLVLAK